VPRIARAWDALDRDRRLAAVASLLLFATMLLPWYQQNAVVSAAKTQPLVSRNLNAFAVFSFVEAAVLLVAVAVLFLLYERADGRTFHLPGGDGTVVFAAGLWTTLLLVLRLFDKPGIAHNGVAANVGVQWGIFFALGAAGLLAYAGSRMRGARRPEPPLLRRERPRATHRERPPAPRPDKSRAGAPHSDAQYPDEPYPDEPHSDEPHPDEQATVVMPARERRPNAATVAARERSRIPPPPAPASPAKPGSRTPIPANAEQLSFDDSPATGD
jgi:hypothetical protein